MEAFDGDVLVCLAIIFRHQVLAELFEQVQPLS